MMHYETGQGKVDLDPQVFGMIAFNTALSMQEIYAVTNARGKVIHLKENGRENFGFIEVNTKELENFVDLKIYVIVNFGKSLSLTAEQFGREARDRIMAVTGIPVRKLTMVITGVKSKKTARRELEMEC